MAESKTTGHSVIQQPVLDEFNLSYHKTAVKVSELLPTMAIATVLGECCAATREWDGEEGASLVTIVIRVLSIFGFIPMKSLDGTAHIAVIGWKQGSTIDQPAVAEVVNFVYVGQEISLTSDNGEETLVKMERADHDHVRFAARKRKVQ